MSFFWKLGRAAQAGLLLGLLETLFESLFPGGSYPKLAWVPFGFSALIFSGGIWAAWGALLALVVPSQQTVRRILWSSITMIGGLIFITNSHGSLLFHGFSLRLFLGAFAVVGWKLGPWIEGKILGAAPGLRWRVGANRLTAAILLILGAGWAWTAVQRLGRSAVSSRIERHPSGPNILILMVDSLRADHLPAYGYPKATAPALHRFLERGSILFQDCQSNSNWTKPSIAATLTGKLLLKQRMDSPSTSLPLGQETLMERFQKAGYQTAWFAANSWLAPEYGLPQGAETIVVPQRGRFLEGLVLGRFARRNEKWGKSLLFWGSLADGVWYRPRWIRDDQLRDAFLDWLPAASDVKTPWAAYVHLMAVHRPYGDTQGNQHAIFVDDESRPEQEAPLELPPLPAHKRKRLREAYDRDIPYTDVCIGQLLAVLEERGDLRRTVVVVTADHGEELGEHGDVGHGRHAFHRGVTHVPLLLWVPGWSGSRRVSHPVQLLDLAPTLLKLCGLPEDPRFEGQDLLKWAQEPAHAPDRTLYNFEQPFTGVRHGPFQLYCRQRRWAEPETVLYDLSKDPMERHNIAREQPKIVLDLLSRLERLKASKQ